jgi:hypothetical protein
VWFGVGHRAQDTAHGLCRAAFHANDEP